MFASSPAANGHPDFAQLIQRAAPINGRVYRQPISPRAVILLFEEPCERSIKLGNTILVFPEHLDQCQWEIAKEACLLANRRIREGSWWRVSRVLNRAALGLDSAAIREHLRARGIQIHEWTIQSILAGRCARKHE